LLDGETARPLPEFGDDIRTGKNTIWMAINETNGWQDKLLTTLNQLLSGGH
jgi:hypothetical protein